ncbi:Uncharacterized protein Rs2_05792 [Raphanus sativus]|nr:Uncharacterized protein Rs2_05792 [Raphanus sativus]
MTPGFHPNDYVEDIGTGVDLMDPNFREASIGPTETSSEFGHSPPRRRNRDTARTHLRDTKAGDHHPRRNGTAPESIRRRRTMEIPPSLGQTLAGPPSERKRCVAGNRDRK